MTATDTRPIEGLEFRDELVVAGLEVREDSETGLREVSGIAVPWDTDAEIRGWLDSFIERFERGAVQDSDDALLYWRHHEPIGRLTAARDADEGWHITAVISKTARGDEAYQLVKDGVIREFSIGFEAIDHREEVENEKRVIVRTRVKVREVSLVPFGAYGKDAPVSQVRERSHPTPKEGSADMGADTITDADLTELREIIEDIERRHAAEIAALTAREHEPRDQFRSLGDMVKRIAAGDETAQRAYDGAVSGETVIGDAWLNKLRATYEERQIVVSTFSKGTLPATGMNVDVVLEGTDTTQAGVQAAEGDNLLFGKVTFTNGTAPIKTIGGWSSQSVQAIERSSLPVVDRTFRALVRKVYRAQEVYARSILNAAVTDATATKLAEVTGTLDSQDNIVAALLNLAEHYEDNDASLDGIFVDKATFLAIYGVAATDRVMQVSGAPTDKVGTVSIKAQSGQITDLPFKILPGAAASTILAYDTEAVETLQSGGLPFRLQDDNIVNLTKDMSAYGYTSTYIPFRAGLTKLVAGA